MPSGEPTTVKASLTAKQITIYDAPSAAVDYWKPLLDDLGPAFLPPTQNLRRPRLSMQRPRQYKAVIDRTAFKSDDEIVLILASHGIHVPSREI
jgi:hypothetical protein